MSDDPEVPNPPPARRKTVKIAEVEAPVAGIIKAAERALETEEATFQSSQAQREARARLHLELRDGPKQANALNTAELISITREPRITGWLRKKGFREWLTGALETEVQVESAYMAAVELISQRIVRGIMADKDLINSVKLLAELANKMPKKWENTRVLDADVGRMSDEQRVSLMVETLRKMGFGIVSPQSVIQKAVDGDVDPFYKEETGGAADSDSIEQPQTLPGTPSPTPPVDWLRNPPEGI